MEVTIDELRRPNYFRDSMVSGPFQRLDHQHAFTANGAMTTMEDIFVFELPWGLLGKFVDSIFLRRYMSRFLAERNQVIKTIAESGDYTRFLATW